MNEQKTSQQYCSIDLEFTGFDPEKDQILEIGFAFFSVEEDGIIIGEQWSQVFKPTIEVHEKIFGLTGITPEELETAPSISEFVSFLSEKLSGAIIVAHNPTLDVKFLEAAGVQLSGQVIDTLELVQFILPTHHSYNLENLAHYFAISHTGSHRALSDALTTIYLIENLLSIYFNFNEKLQSELRAVMARGNFLWQTLFATQFPTKRISRNDTLGADETRTLDTLQIQFPITLDAQHYGHEFRLACSLQKTPGSWLLVVPDKQQVLQLWQQGFVSGLFSSGDVFDKRHFDLFLENATTSEELRFSLKIIVWFHTNWQTQTVLDLNLSFFGGQFKSFIVGGRQSDSVAPVVACDYKTFASLRYLDNLKTRTLIVAKLQEFEQFLTSGSKSRVSWNSVNYGLKLIYNPETHYGDSTRAAGVIAALAAVDLFFGLVQIVIRNKFKSLYVSVNDLKAQESYQYNRLVRAAENLQGKLAAAIGDQSDSLLHSQLNSLEQFFSEEQGVVKWISLDDENTTLHSQPLNIVEDAQEITRPFHKFAFTETITDEPILFYYAERLGLNAEIADISNVYFSLSASTQSIDVSTDELLLNHLQSLTGAQIVVFPNPAAVKSFYKTYYAVLKEQFTVLAQEYSGSGNKMFRNFKIFPNVLLMATPQFIAKQKYSVAASGVTFISVPSVDEAHPYNSVVAQTEPERFQKYKEIYGTAKMIDVIKQVSGEQLPKIYLNTKV